VPDPAFAPRPKYPRKARVRRWEGTAILEVEVSESGAPLQIRLHKSSGHAILDEAALETVRTWKFVPGQKGGKASKTTVQVPVTFRLVDR
ncbi:MAG: energy transducer TonB, partial [Planctomycetota bacterium]